jgi:hypothetical protein
MRILTRAPAYPVAHLLLLGRFPWFVDEICFATFAQAAEGIRPGELPIVLIPGEPGRARAGFSRHADRRSRAREPGALDRRASSWLRLEGRAVGRWTRPAPGPPVLLYDRAP